MKHILQNTIHWNRNAIRRSTRMLKRATTERQRRIHRENISRYEQNIERLRSA